MTILRELERRVPRGKRFNVPEKEMTFPQSVAPGDASQSDFTHCDDLGVTIAGVGL